MTNHEATDELQYTIDLIKQDGQDWLDERDIPILEAAISALEKQIPKKPEKCIEFGTLFELYCPTCDTKIGYGFDFSGVIKKYNDMKNCVHCGQAIDWTEDEG